MASSSVVVCSRLRERPRPGLLDHPAGVDRLLHRGHDQPRAELGHAPVAELEHLVEVVAGVDVHDREREPAGQNAFSARRSMTIESLPPENSSTGRSNSAATSRMMWIDSASRARRCDSSYDMEATRVRGQMRAEKPCPAAAYSGAATPWPHRPATYFWRSAGSSICRVPLPIRTKNRVCFTA